jgi:hypothetical protein
MDSSLVLYDYRPASTFFSTRIGDAAGRALARRDSQAQSEREKSGANCAGGTRRRRSSDAVFLQRLLVQCDAQPRLLGNPIVAAFLDHERLYHDVVFSDVRQADDDLDGG